jgi:protein-disulfide isomerase
MISDELLDEAVTKLELDKVKFKSCLNTVASTRLNLEIKRAKKLGTSYTPTIFLNGRKISDTFRTNESVKKLLETIIGDTIKQQN